jgi:putative transcriptional regulator
MGKQHRSDALAAVHETASSPHEAGIIGERTMKDFDDRCLTPVKEPTPRQVRLREKASRAKTTPRK